MADASDQPPTPRSVCAAGVDCGVSGTWAVSGPSGTGISLDMRPAGITANPAVGDVTITGVPDDGSGSGGIDVSVGVADDPALLWNAFEATGTLSGIESAATAATTGAVSINGSVPAYGNVTLSFVLSWYFPDRNHLSEDIGKRHREMGRACERDFDLAG